MKSRAVMAVWLAALAPESPRAAGAEAPTTSPSPSPQALVADCDRGDQRACTALGYHLVSDDAMPPDVPRALELWRRGCAAGHLPACLPYGQLLLTGYEPSGARRYVSGRQGQEKIAPDRSQGKKVLAQACDRGHAPACDTLGAALLRDKRDRGESCRLFRRACAAGDQGG